MMLFGIGWGIVALAPTSIFARSANADHYLMFPLVGVVVAIAAVLETHARVAVWFALAFSVAGCVQLIQYRNQWNAAAEQVQGLERELRARVNRPVERLTLVDLPHDGIANGVKGILIQAGLPERVQVRHNFFNARSQSESLVSRLTGCSTRPSVDQTYVYQQGALRDVSGPCATAIVDDDIGARPYEWH
jgi:hypothetical protein